MLWKGRPTLPFLYFWDELPESLSINAFQMNRMKISIIGYGKMGKEIAHMAKQRGHDISLIIDQENQSDLGQKKLQTTDVAIEFTTPEAAPQNILACFKAGIPVVSGTTGWHTELVRIQNECVRGNHAFFYAPNFSIGMNLFFKINEMVGIWMNQLEAYDVRVTETHHTQKMDKPSGTAVALAQDLVRVLDRKNNWKSNPENEWKMEDIPVYSKRTGSIPGTHVITWDSPVDLIELKHEAKNRTGFALGALLAAEYLQNRKGVFGMKDLLGF